MLEIKYILQRKILPSLDIFAIILNKIPKNVEQL